MALWSGRRSKALVPIVPVGTEDTPPSGPQPALLPAWTVEPVGQVSIEVGADGRSITVAGDQVPELQLEVTERTTKRGFRRFDRDTVRSFRNGVTGRVGSDVLQLRLHTSLRRRNRALEVDIGSRRLTLVPRGLPGAGRTRVRRVGVRGDLARFGPHGITVDAGADPAEIAAVVFLAGLHAERLVAAPVTPVLGNHVGEFFAEGVGQVIIEWLIRLAVEAFAALLDGL